MKIIVVGPDYSKYNAASYQYEFMNSLMEISEKYFHYSKNIEIDEEQLYKKAKFVPDVIFYNHGWLQDNPSIEKINFGKINRNSSNKEIKHVIFLNKEYTRLKEKLNEIKRYKYDLIFTHLHNFKELNNSSKDSRFLPLASRYENISNMRNRRLEERKYDYFFRESYKIWIINICKVI